MAGPRTGFPQHRIDETLDGYLATHGRDRLVIIEGCARGVDTQAFQWAVNRGIAAQVLHYPAPWSHLDKAAGRWRNRAMIRVCRAEAAVIFHPDIQNGHGSKDMALAAAKADLPVHLVGSTMPL